MKKSNLAKHPQSIIHYKYYLLLIAIVFLVFGNSIGNGYNMDDNLVTQHHPLTSQKGIHAIVNIFTKPYFQDAMGNSYGYRPIVLLVFFLEHQFFGESPLVSHIINLILYTLSLILFLKLLVSWLGEKGLLLGILSVILFAVHPVHTEVVASIKNRDEILAFLFAILSGLAIERYLKTNTIVSLIAISAFFTLGMLSKKSIYSMTLILPIATMLLKDIDLKQILFVSAAIIFPAAIIGSNLEIARFVVLFSFPFAGLLIVHFVKSGLRIHEVLEKDYIIYVFYVLSWFFFFIAIWQNNYVFYFLFSVPILLFSIKKNESWSLIQLVLQITLIGWLFSIGELLMISFLISLGYCIYSFLYHKRDWKLLITTLISTSFFCWYNVNYYGSVGSFFVILIISSFFYLTFKKAKWGLLLAIIMLVLAPFLLFFGLVHFILFMFSFFVFLNVKRKSYNFIYYSFSAVLIVSLVYIFIQLNYFSQSGKTISNIPIEQSHHAIITKSNNQSPINKSVMREGRKLEYVENTLVATHTFGETVGTGFISIGNYFKLMIFPKELSFYYGYSKIKTAALTNLWVWLSILIHVGLIMLAIWQFKTRPVLSIGIVWYLISILLFSNWAELVAGMVGERLAFTASAGFSICVASIILWAKPDFSFTKPKRVELLVFTIFLLLGGRTIARNMDWQDPVTLMGHDIKHLKNSAQANNLYAIFLMKEATENSKLAPELKDSNRKQAILHFKQAISIYPDFFNANFDLGRAYIDAGDFINAKQTFEQLYIKDPENILVIEELTKTSFDLKQKLETEYYGNIYIDKNPQNENIHELIAYIMLINNDKEKAKVYSERGLKYFSSNQNLQLILAESQK